MAPRNLLELLRSRTVVDCDTMEFQVAKSLGPFTDCTSNQAIAFFELGKPENKSLLDEAVETTKKLLGEYTNVTYHGLAVEVAMIKLQLAISSVVTGFVHVQTDPYHSYDTKTMVEDARRIISIFSHLDPDFDTKRICLKIPSTWEGLQACKILEASGITTLATTLFTIEQAALAGEVGCTYVAPYVNELKVHFEAGFIDTNKAHKLCFQIQQYYRKHNHKAKVLPASLTNIDEIMMLAGVDHITIAPALLRELAATSIQGYEVKSLFDGDLEVENVPLLMEFANYESGWRLDFTRSGKGEGERKLSQRPMGIHTGETGAVETRNKKPAWGDK
ncbi:transaldolase [Sclerotinia borealis F-4128]|uniref:Transaldolase n=1 Tax=Sclerotinia borealis (strain F-4128) TaxID=1432307 RepID=W9CIK9_SCLBF|nr:transaldolase [Sclerotinia borealis F-4128]